MADDTTMTPVEGAEPPKANPLAKPAASSSTLKLKPVERASGQTGLKLPSKPGLSTAGLKLPPKPGLATAGLKLPPKPGLATQTGLKLPPKPGLATQTGLKLPPKPGLATAGLKLPPKPGLATRTGLKLPPKPLIRKPGSAPSLARPTAPGLNAAAKPVQPAAPVPSTAPAASIPAATAPAASAAAPSVPELTPVTPTEISKIEKPLDALKSATQHLKSVTAPIPQQAILRKTGMLAEDKTAVAQREAAKSKTSRISLSEAMGAAPVSNENAPMKTIRIRRPIDIPGAPAESKSDAAPSADAKSADTAAPAVDTEAATKPAVTLTQRKTLKISRPTGGVMRPSGKFGIKRPGTMMTAKAEKPAESNPTAGTGEKAEGDVPEIADIPSLPAAPVPNAASAGEPDLPKAVSIVGILVQAAACVAMGALAWFLYTDTQILPF